MTLEFLKTTFTVDWITATWRSGMEAGRFFHWLGFDTKPTTRVHAPKSYRDGWRLETGAVMASRVFEGQTEYILVMSGAALRAHHNAGQTWMQILFGIRESSGRVSRVDLAIDIHNGELTQANFAKSELTPYKGKGRTPNFMSVTNGDGGWTQYIGARTSDKFLRIYDKAAEIGERWRDIVRVELECKGEVAHAVGWNFGELSEQDCVAMAQTLIRGTVNFENPAWRKAMHGKDVALAISEAKERDTMGWLIRVCAPSLARQVAENPSKDVLGEFTEALRDELAKWSVDVV